MKKYLSLFLSIILILNFGINSYTETNKAEKTATEKALKYVNYFIEPDANAVAWSDKNMVGDIKNNPYRNTLPNKDMIRANRTSLLKKLNKNYKSNLSIHKISFYKIQNISKNKLFVIVKRKTDINAVSAQKHNKVVLHKIWFKKINKEWLIYNYYSIRTNYYVDGKEKNDQQEVTPNGQYLDYDQVASEFPF